MKVYDRPYGRCSACDLIYRNREERYEAVLATYRGEYFNNCGQDQIGGSREKLYDHILDVLEKRCGIGSLLDVGTGCGQFLIRALQRGWQAKGIEPSADAICAAAGENLEIFHGTLREFRGKEQFDVISLINVLDHSAAPWDEIRHTRKLLKPDGLIFIRIPNGLLHYNLLQAATACGVGKQIQQFLIFHQYSFTPRFVKKLLQDFGFSDIAIFNSRPSSGDPNGLFKSQFVAQWLKTLLYLFANLAAHISRSMIRIGTSLDVIACKAKS